MDALFSALADPVRWRLVSLLAERPRPVGVLAQLAGARQPQTSKHLQTLERAGLVRAERTGQRRIYSLRTAPLHELATALTRLADTVEQDGSPYEAYGSHGRTRDAEQPAAADGPGGVDGPVLTFHRSLRGSTARVWRHLTEPQLLRHWWPPDGLKVSELIFEPWQGGRILVEYLGTEGAADSDAPAGGAAGTVEESHPGERLGYRFSRRLPAGGTACSARVTFALAATDDGTDLDVTCRVTDSTGGRADSADPAAVVDGAGLGFGRSLDRLAAALIAETGPHAREGKR